MADKKVKIIISAIDKTQQAINKSQKNLAGLKKSVLSLKSAFIGLGAGLVLKSFVDVGKEVESLQVRFKFLFGSAKEGAKAFDNLADFAAKVPFSLGDIAAASGNLAVVAKDAEDLSRILEITGNVAATTGLDFQTTASQIQRAFSGGIAAADVFREKGVRSLLGFQQGAKVSIEDTVKAFEDVFSGEGRFGKATDELAKTFEGTVSMLQDSVFKFQKTVAEGFLAEFTKQLGDLKKFLDANKVSINEFAISTGVVLAKALIKLAGAIKIVAENYREFEQLVGALLIITGGFAKKIIGLALTVDALVGAFKDANKQIKTTNTELRIFNKTIERNNKVFEENEKQLNEHKKSLAAVKDQFTALTRAEVAFEEGLNQQKRAAREANKVLGTYGKTAKTIREELGNKLITGLGGAEEALGKFTTGVAEAIVMGKSFGSVLKVLAQEILVFFISQLLQTVIMALFLRDALVAIENKIEDWKNGLNNASSSQRNFTNEILKTNAALTLQNSLMGGRKKPSLLGGLFGFATGGIGGAIGGLLGFADGGRPPLNRPSIVGERGAELFVPDSAGTVVPNEALGGTTNINFNITTVDAQGFGTLLDSKRGQIINMVNTALNSKGRSALV